MPFRGRRSRCNVGALIIADTILGVPYYRLIWGGLELLEGLRFFAATALNVNLHIVPHSRPLD